MSRHSSRSAKPPFDVGPGVSRRDVLGLAGAAATFASVTSRAAVAGSEPGSPARRTGRFPPRFLWGTATAAYQIEGAASEDGRGPSVWDTFCRKPGAVFEGQTGDVACDHYHRWREDIGLLRNLGVNAYRFSVSWTRVLPQGRGAVNAKGLDFYDRLVDGLAAAHITPVCTLFHWDFPQALYDQGGWMNRDVAGWFGDYAAIVADRLSDRVRFWATQNEPQVFLGHGHLLGKHAPGDKLPFRDFLTCLHNSLRAHGRAATALRAHAKKEVLVGYVTAVAPAQPANDGADDLQAARTAQWRVTERSPGNQAWYFDPLIRGHYPQDGLASFGKDVPAFESRDFDEIKQPLDFIGLNIYTSRLWQRGKDGEPEALKTPVGYPHSAVDWQPLRPAALYWGPRHFLERYGIPVYITESGLSTRDQLFLDGKVHDPHRIDYLQRVLLELRRAVNEGLDVRGYFVWSLMDNFEWADGYKQRFGLVYVDYPTQKRVPKDSYHWYRRTIASGGRLLDAGTTVPPAQMTPL